MGNTRQLRLTSPKLLKRPSNHASQPSGCAPSTRSAKGLTTRQIAGVTGWSHETIAADLRQNSDSARQNSDSELTPTSVLGSIYFSPRAEAGFCSGLGTCPRLGNTRRRNFY